jgi:hypothetical protein
MRPMPNDCPIRNILNKRATTKMDQKLSSLRFKNTETDHSKIKRYESFCFTPPILHQYTDDTHDAGKYIGPFSTREIAEAAIKRYLLLPGFRVWPDGFGIDEYELDEPSWCEGFSYPDPAPLTSDLAADSSRG